MAKEDIVPQLFRQLMQKEGPPAETDNTVLQKMVVPQDSVTFSDSVTVSKNTLANMKWGTSNSNYYFAWGQGQWQ